MDILSTDWLSSLRAHIMPTGIGRARAELFEKQILHHGGQICSAQAPGVTHIVVDENMDCERALRLLRLPQLPPSAQLVKSSWLSLCLQERRVMDTAGFSLSIPKRWAAPSLSQVLVDTILTYSQTTPMFSIGHTWKPKFQWSERSGTEAGKSFDTLTACDLSCPLVPPANHSPARQTKTPLPLVPRRLHPGRPSLLPLLTPELHLLPKRQRRHQEPRPR